MGTKKGFWKSDGLVSQEGMSTYLVQVNHRTGGISQKIMMVPGLWTGTWEYSAVGEKFLSAKQQKDFLEMILTWHEWIFGWSYVSAHVSMRYVGNSPFFEGVVSFDKDSGFYDLGQFSDVIKNYSTMLTKDPTKVIMTVSCTLRHQGHQNPARTNKDKVSLPVAIPGSNSQFFIKSDIVYQWMDQVAKSCGKDSCLGFLENNYIEEPDTTGMLYNPFTNRWVWV